MSAWVENDDPEGKDTETMSELLMNPVMVTKGVMSRCLTHVGQRSKSKLAERSLRTMKQGGRKDG